MKYHRPWTTCETTYTHWAGHQARIIQIFDSRGFEVASLPLGLSRSDIEQHDAARLIFDAIPLDTENESG